MTTGSLILGAARLASLLHRGQTREVSGDPYERHLGRVAARVTVFTIEEHGLDADEELVAAAWLHDSREDTVVTYDELLKRFGKRVADTVEGLTNQFTSKAHPKMPRTTRKVRELERLAAEPLHVRAIKLVDRHDNLREIDPTKEFAQVYSGESDWLIQLGRQSSVKADLPRLADELSGELASLRRKISSAKAARATVSDEDLVAIVEDVENEPHPDCWKHCGQGEVMAITKELQASRAARGRVDAVLKRLGLPSYLPVFGEDGGYAAHHNVVRIVRSALNDDPALKMFWEGVGHA